MPVTVQCPACGKSAGVPDRYLGKSLRCRQCGHTFEASGSPAPPDSSASARETNQDLASAEQQPPGPPGDPGKAIVQSLEASATTQIGHFLIRSRLGSGAFGTVYRAYDTQLDREVALKVPQSGTLQKAKAVERFLREAKAAARLRHPHIVPLYEAGWHENTYYLAYAFIEGRTLADAIEEGPLDPVAAATIVRDLAEALAYAHEEGIVHRDVKSANIMLDTKGKAHLMDFGLAYRQDAADRLTQDGTVLGTPAYIAPEQAAGKHGEALPASDQYSLGVVLYEMLCGETPFRGPSTVVLFNTLHHDPPAPRSLRQDLPEDLERICLKALAKRPEDRYPSCQEFADDLQRWLQGERIHAPLATGPEPAAPAAARRRLGRKGRLALAGLLAGTLATGLIFWSFGRHADTGAGRGSGRPIEEPAASPPAALQLAGLEEMTLETGKSKFLDVAVKRQGCEGTITLQVERLPAGVTFEPATIPEGKESTRLALRADAKAQEGTWEASVVARLGDVQTWGPMKITVSAPPLSLAPLQDVILQAGGQTRLRVRVIRHRCPPGPIQLQVRALQAPLQAKPAVISADKDQAEIELSAPIGVKPTVQKATLLASLGDVQAEQPFLISVVKPLLFALPRNLRFTLGRGEARRLQIPLTRHGYPGPIKLRWEGLPDKVVATPDVLPAGKDIAKLNVTVAKEAATGLRQATLVAEVPERGAEDQIKLDLNLVAVGFLQEWDRCKEFRAMTFSPDGHYFFGLSALPGPEAWDVRTEEQAPIKNFFKVDLQPDLQFLGFCADGRHAVFRDKHDDAKGKDIASPLYLYDLSNGKGQPTRLKAKASWMETWSCSIFSSDGRRALSNHLLKGSPDWTVRVWDLETGQGIPRFNHTNGVQCVALSPDGRLALSGDKDKILRLWEVDSGKELHQFHGHQGAVECVTFSADGRLALSGGQDKTVRLWQLDTGKEKELYCFKGHNGVVRSVAFCPDGLRALSSASDRTLRLWKLPE